MRVEKKIWPEFFDAVEKGEKKVEIRLADFEIAGGDELVLKEWDPKRKQYTGREIVKKVKSAIKVDIQALRKFYKLKDIEKQGVWVIELE